MRLPLTQELLLIALDDKSGKRRKTETIDYGLAGAALVDLALRGRLTVQDSRIIVVSHAPTGDQVLDGVLARIAGDKPRKTKPWVGKLYRGMNRRVAAQLVAAEIVREEQQHILGFIPVTRHPAADDRPESEIRTRLNAAVLGRVEPDERTAGLVALIGATELVGVAFPGQRPRDLKARIKEISAGSWGSEAVRRAISDIRSATTAAIAAGAVAAGGN